MLQLILIRPGCTDYDQQLRIQGCLDIPLNEAGRQQAIEAANLLRSYLPTALYCSPCRNARETAELLGELLNLKLKKLDDFQNLNQGLWQGMLVEEVRHKQPKVYKQWQEHPETVCPPQGEGLAGAAQRAEDALEKLARKHRTGTIVLVVPEPLASVIQHRLEGGELGDLWQAGNGCERIDVLHLDRNLAGADRGNGNSNEAHAPTELDTHNYHEATMMSRQ